FFQLTAEFARIDCVSAHPAGAVHRRTRDCLIEFLDSTGRHRHTFLAPIRKEERHHRLVIRRRGDLNSRDLREIEQTDFSVHSKLKEHDMTSRANVKWITTLMK